MKYFADRL